MQEQTLSKPSGNADAILNIIDHLVNALGSEPSCKLVRALILTDIDNNPATTQTEIMERLNLSKSSLNRDIDWLYDYGCITRTPSPQDSRALELRVCGYAKKNIDLALSYFSYDHSRLKNFILNLTNMFGAHKPTMRDAKIIATIGGQGAISRQEIYEFLYNGPITTDNRAVNNFINFGLLQKKDDE